MSVDPKHSMPDIGSSTIGEWEEHGHVSGETEGAAHKVVFGAPAAYKAFPSLASGYTYHAISRPGTASGASTWRVLRETRNTGTIEWADGDSNWDNDIIDVTSLTYL